MRFCVEKSQIFFMVNIKSVNNDPKSWRLSVSKGTPAILQPAKMINHPLVKTNYADNL